MLVLSRKINESVMIGEDIEVLVIESKDGSVKIGIRAPKNVRVYRKEIFEEIKNENKQALSADIDMVRKLLVDKEVEK